MTSGITYLGDHNRRKADERGAERLVLAEVLSDDALPSSAGSVRLQADAAWRAERERLARSLNNTEWAWVARYYRDLEQARRSKTAVRIPRLETDCTLAALNAWLYSDLPRLNALRKNSDMCKNLPGTL